MRINISSIFMLPVLLSLLGVPGCADQRALSIVRRDADRLSQTKQYELAAADYQEVVDRDPNDWEYRVKLSDTLMRLGRESQAREQLAIVHGVRPDDEAITDKYIEAMFKSGDHARLMSFLQTRAEETKTVADYLRLGWYASQTGDADLAERALLTAARLDGGATVEPQLALADLYSAVGDRERALRRLRMALYIEPMNETVRSKIRSLGEIPGPSFALSPDEGV